MTELCTKCGMQISLPWSFCPHCGTAVQSQPHHQPAPAETEKAPAKNAFSGLLFGFIVAPICIIVGTMLCLTGLGVFLGIPVIILGILAPLLGPMIGIGELKGKCPACGIELNNIVNTPVFACYGCGERIAVENHKFIKAA